MVERDDKELLAKLEKHALNDVKFYSNSNKPERERWVVVKFLSILNIQHQYEEVCCLEQKMKADVHFRGAFFQVKELTNPDLKRGKLYKDAYNSIKAAKSLDDVRWIGEVQDVPPIVTMYDLIREKTEDLAEGKYCSFKAELDLLFYVTRHCASLIQQSELRIDDFLSLGWRSVSCVNEKQAVVLFASQCAPKFIVERSQKVFNAEPYD